MILNIYIELKQSARLDSVNFTPGRVDCKPRQTFQQEEVIYPKETFIPRIFFRNKSPEASSESNIPEGADEQGVFIR